jgi:ankyrin repeat protein
MVNVYDAKPDKLAKIIDKYVGNNRKLKIKETAVQMEYPLHHAACQGDLPRIKASLTQGININSLDENLRSALHWAAANGHSDAVLFLLKKGAIAGLRDLQNNRAQDLALTSEIKTVIKIQDSFKSAAYECNMQELKKLLELKAGFFINTPDPYGRTPLHFAAWNNKLKVAHLLLQVANINVNAQDCFGGTPLHDAASLGYLDVMDLLFRSGADLSITDKYGRTAADVAANEATRQLILNSSPDHE